MQQKRSTVIGLEARVSAVLLIGDMCSVTSMKNIRSMNVTRCRRYVRRYTSFVGFLGVYVEKTIYRS